MSHNIKMCSYPENVNKKLVQKEWDDYVSKADWEEGCSGLYQDIRWIDHICVNKEEAEKYIEEHDKGWYDQLAVKYRVYIIKPSKKLETLNKKKEEEELKLRELQCKIHYENVKSSYVSCRCCGSKLSTKYVKRIRNTCPICLQDIRPNTVLETIKRYQEKIKKIKQEIKKENRKLEEKYLKTAKIMWLVKIEYHT